MALKAAYIVFCIASANVLSTEGRKIKMVPGDKINITCGDDGRISIERVKFKPLRTSCRPLRSNDTDPMYVELLEACQGQGHCDNVTAQWINAMCNGTKIEPGEVVVKYSCISYTTNSLQTETGTVTSWETTSDQRTSGPDPDTRSHVTTTSTLTLSTELNTTTVTTRPKNTSSDYPEETPIQYFSTSETRQAYTVVTATVDNPDVTKLSSVDDDVGLNMRVFAVSVTQTPATAVFDLPVIHSTTPLMEVMAADTRPLVIALVVVVSLCLIVIVIQSAVIIVLRRRHSSRDGKCGPEEYEMYTVVPNVHQKERHQAAPQGRAASLVVYETCSANFYMSVDMESAGGDPLGVTGTTVLSTTTTGIGPEAGHRRGRAAPSVSGDYDLAVSTMTVTDGVDKSNILDELDGGDDDTFLEDNVQYHPFQGQPTQSKDSLTTAEIHVQDTVQSRLGVKSPEKVRALPVSDEDGTFLQENIQYEPWEIQTKENTGQQSVHVHGSVDTNPHSAGVTRGSDLDVKKTPKGREGPESEGAVPIPSIAEEPVNGRRTQNSRRLHSEPTIDVKSPSESHSGVKNVSTHRTRRPTFPVITESVKRRSSDIYENFDNVHLRTT